MMPALCAPPTPPWLTQIDAGADPFHRHDAR
eukprot:CAMPEP_0119413650 /NCGR_PEP_ID=MMETSP1335-20130426/5658_1 /TAXON_ID=259385 /ORGANISM="Chrysoculter rhomboideus, Strain RCC1486" /LENGTH=30 /DNA_ID= /DNA_START= /DNA_END= /DNA_ORIENTATION=